MFYGNDPDGKGYSTRAHLAEVIAILGPPPLDMLKCGKRSSEFFDEDGNYKPLLINVTHDTKYLAEPSNDICILGKWKSNIEIPQGRSLEQSEEFLGGKNKEMFLSFMRGMLQWRPEDRKTAKELIEDPWLNS